MHPLLAVAVFCLAIVLARLWRLGPEGLLAGAAGLAMLTAGLGALGGPAGAVAAEAFWVLLAAALAVGVVSE